LGFTVYENIIYDSFVQTKPRSRFGKMIGNWNRMVKNINRSKKFGAGGQWLDDE